MDKIVRTEIKARYAETDMMGIIHHSVYPVWFEAARTDFIKSVGISYSQLEKQGVMLPLTSLSCRYIIPVHYEDEVTIEVKADKVSAAKIDFSYRVILDGKIMAEGFTSHGFVDSKTFKPINMKKFKPEIYKALSEMVKDEW